MAERIRVTVDGVVYHAVLLENTLAEKIASMCPFTLKFARSGEHEYYAALPKKTAANGCPDTMKGHRNGLYYFEGWNALSLVFRDCDTTPYKIHHIGDFEEDVATILEKMGRSIHILCETE